jgi:hypothetical protein
VETSFAEEEKISFFLTSLFTNFFTTNCWVVLVIKTRNYHKYYIETALTAFFQSIYTIVTYSLLIWERI